MADDRRDATARTWHIDVNSQLECFSLTIKVAIRRDPGVCRVSNVSLPIPGELFRPDRPAALKGIVEIHKWRCRRYLYL